MRTILRLFGTILTETRPGGGGRVWRLAGVLPLILAASEAHATSNGVPSTFFTPNLGCNLCHNGGLAPAVMLDGPTAVEAGSTNEYTFTILATGSQNHGGLNAAIPVGVLSTGGAFSGGTRLIAGTGGRNEVTHTGPKAADGGGMIQFSFLWTAPDPFEGTTLRTWGNAVDFNGNDTGDRASMAELEISGAEAETPTPTATEPMPTPTATPPANPTVTPTTAAGACVGDCNGDNVVSINEVITGVNIGLELLPLSSCAAFDANGDGMVAVNELIQGVNNGLGGCPG
jgi:hypothetical protein